MRKRIFDVLAPVAWLAGCLIVGSCSWLGGKSSEQAGCPCNAGYQCVDDVRCVQHCSAPDECGEGLACIGGLCVELEGHDSYVVNLPEPLKIDMLWVMDPSVGMCRAMLAVTQSFDLLAKRLGSRGDVDLRLAVTTTDAANNRGKFVNTPAQTFPPACVEYRPTPCMGDIDCEKEHGNGWTCKDYAADQMYNFNGSLNSSCTFRCAGDGECCEEFCTDECGKDESCIVDMCQDAPHEDCTYICRNADEPQVSGCSRPPDTGDCPPNLPTKLTMQNIDLFKCLATVAPMQTYSANIEQGLAAGWLALDPEGPNAEQSAGFLRDDAYLMVVFVSDEEDCSIDEDYCSPNAFCDDPEDKAKCTKEGGKCKLDVQYSYIRGQETRLCCGTIKKDYFNVCGLLGEYKGYDHHVQSYDLTQSDCQHDEDCDEGWFCKESSGRHKCRPYIFSFPHIADYFNPPGAPIFSLSPVTGFHSHFKSLKEDPSMVLVATITADGLMVADDLKSLVSKKCLGEEGTESDKDLAAKLDKCIAYNEAKAADAAGCEADPGKEGCDEFYQAKLDCIRQCYMASKGNAKNVQTARNSYVCQTNGGKGDYGGRYVKLARMFGPNGLATNVCADATLETNMVDIADLLERRTVRLCLPRAPEEWETVAITVLSAEGEESQQLSAGGDFIIQKNVAACCQPVSSECTGSSVGVLLSVQVEPDSQFQVEYVVVR